MAHKNPHATKHNKLEDSVRNLRLYLKASNEFLGLFQPVALGPGRKSGNILSNGFLDQLPMCPRFHEKERYEERDQGPMSTVVGERIGRWRSDPRFSRLFDSFSWQSRKRIYSTPSVSFILMEVNK